MKLQVIIEILVLSALVAFATARVIDSRSYDEDIAAFSGRLISNATKNINKNRQNEIVVTSSDYDEPIGSQEISVGEEDLISATNNNNNNISNDVPTNSASSGALTTSNEENNVSEQAEGDTEAPVNIDDAHPLNRYCTCTEAECNCCREFKLPLVSVRGPGCASLRYLGKNRMSIAIKYGDITLTSRTISGRKARPVCLNLPGGFSQFCGRIYGINRESDDFQACLGLELRAEEEVEAALRVSCFKFGPKGLKMTDAQPLPPVVDAVEDDEDEEGGGLLGLVTGAGDSDEDEEDDEDGEEEGQDDGGSATGDEDTDLLGFAEDEDDDDDDDDDDPEEFDDEEEDEGAAPPDYPSGFSLLDGIFGDSSNKKKKPVQTRNKVNTVAEDVKVNQVGAKVKIPNSQAILNSASLSQNEVDNTVPKDTQLDPVDLTATPAAAVAAAAAPVAAAVDSALAADKPLETVISELQSNAGIPLVSTTAKPPKKKPSSSFLDTIESLISGGDDDDDDDDEDEDAVKDEEAEDDEDDEEEADEPEDEEEKDDEEEEEEEKEEEAETEDDDEEEEEDEEEDDEAEDDEAAAESTVNDKETTTATKDEKNKETKKTTKKKSNFGLGFFARLMKFI